MTEDVLEEMNIGLSEAEKNDLEEMIKVFRKMPSDISEALDPKDVYSQILSISENLGQYAEILLKMDKKIKLLYGMLRLSDQKTRIMNQRIDAVVELLKGQKILIEK
jgi:hypothetical protein